MGQIQVII